MRRTLVPGIAAVMAGVLAALASGAASSDIYITGEVLIKGRSSSQVLIKWDYKCLGEDRGKYEWTLKVTRTQPLPEKTTTLGSGTSERGTKTVQLTPGQYVPTANPYYCETTRGQGYDKAEVGAPFTVPDYCAWRIVAARGAVELEQGSSVKLARPGSTVAPGDALATPAGGGATISSLFDDGKATLGGGSNVSLARRCAPTGGWKFRLDAGSLTVSVPATAGKGGYQTATARATATGARGATWRIEVAGGKTTVRVLAGTVRVGAKVLKAGQSTTVR